MVTNPSFGIKHAFVTGATGIVGVPLCRELVAAGVRVTAFSRNAGEYGFPEEVEHQLGDILDIDSLHIAAADADAVFHVAAAVHGSAESYEDFKKMNIDGTENVIRLTRNLGAKLVHVSSVNVEGFLDGDLVDAYAATKSRAEELVVEAVANGLEAVIVRPATVFGNEAGRAGLLVDRLFSGSLKILPAPSRMISPVWSHDLAKALIRAGSIGTSGQVYTVAGDPMSTGAFVNAVCESGGLRKPWLSIPGILFAIPLQVAWWLRGVSRWTPSVSVESLLTGSNHDGSEAAKELGFEYTPICQIFD